MEKTSVFSTITVHDQAPSLLPNTNEISRQLYFYPKVALGEANLDQLGDSGDEDDESPIQLDDETWEQLRCQRTIVVYGSPVHYSTELVQEIFSIFGEIDNVTFLPDADPLSRIAEVTFTEQDDYEAALSTTGASAHINSQETSFAQLGAAQYFKHWADMRPDPKNLQRQVNLFMMAFDERAAAKQQQSKRPIVDEDGFILVTDKHDGVNTTTAAKRMKRQNKVRVKKQEDKLRAVRHSTLPFYQFHEKQQHRLNEQAASHAQTRDAQVIGKLKKQRNFNPF